MAHALCSSKILEPLSGLTAAHVAGAKDVLHFSREEQVLELFWDVGRSLWDVEVTNHECKLFTMS